MPAISRVKQIPSAMISLVEDNADLHEPALLDADDHNEHEQREDDRVVGQEGFRRFFGERDVAEGGAPGILDAAVDGDDDAEADHDDRQVKNHLGQVNGELQEQTEDDQNAAANDEAKGEFRAGDDLSLHS